MDSLCRVLYFKGSRHPRARGRGAAARGLEPVDLLQVSSGARLRQQLEPCDSCLPALALGGIGGSVDASVLGALCLSQLRGGGVEVEEGRGGGGEVVDAADDEVARCHLGRVGEVELQGYPGQCVEQVGIDSGNAGCVVEGR